MVQIMALRAMNMVMVYIKKILVSNRYGASLYKYIKNLLGRNRNGAWLHTETTLGWLYDKEIFSQLPPYFKAYSLLCRFILLFSNQIIFGYSFFRITSMLHRISGDKEIQLKIENKTIFLNPNDPRMLQVPNEVIKQLSPEGILSRFLGPGDCFIDIGANHGSFSIAASTFIGKNGYIAAFEPNPDLYPLIEKTLSRSCSRYNVFPVALGDKSQIREFFVPIGSSGEGGLFQGYSGLTSNKKISVKVAVLDEIILNMDIPKRVFMKLDVEGSEFSVLKGGRMFIDKYSPIILMELLPSAMKAASVSGHEMIALLEELRCIGFKNLSAIDDDICQDLHKIPVDGQLGDVILFFQGYQPL